MLFFAFRKKLLSKRFLGRGCLKIEKRFCPMASEQGHAFANLASQRILSEKLRFPCFSQVPAGSDYPLFEAIGQKLMLLLLHLSTKYLFDRKLRGWRKEGAVKIKVLKRFSAI